MKKSAIAVLAVSTAAAVLSGCGAPKPKTAPSPNPTTKTETVQKQRYDDSRIDVLRDFRLGSLVPIFGVRRRMPDSLAGEYTVEYVHRHRDVEKDDTLDYSLTLREDNTYDMRVVTNGVKAEHYGNWYVHSGGGMTLYFDEPIDKPAHNVYVSDSMYAELLPYGKIMIYDGGNTIVMSRGNGVPMPLPEPPVFYEVI